MANNIVLLSRLQRFYNNHIKVMFNDVDERCEETESEMVGLSESVNAINSGYINLKVNPTEQEKAKMNIWIEE